MSTTTEKMLRELASRGEKFPTPVYIVNQTALEENIDELYRAFYSRFRRFIFAYSYKTNYASDILCTIHRKGGYAEVVSPMELRHALNQVSGEKIIYNGVIPDTATKYDLAKAGGMVNVENFGELRAIDGYARREGQSVEVGIRVNLDLAGTAPSRFGIEINGEALTEIANLRNVRIAGLHCHITKSRGLAFWREKAEQLAVIAQKAGAARYLDFGGNMYGRMHPDLAAQFHCAIPTFQDYADCIHDVLARYFQPEDMPTVIVEAGTPIVANAQSLLTSVVDIKTIRGKTICTLDAKQLDVSVIGDLDPEEIKQFDFNELHATCEIPDWVYDVHTRKGKMNGKTKIDMIRDEQEAITPHQISLFDDGDWSQFVESERASGHMSRREEEQYKPFSAGRKRYY